MKHALVLAPFAPAELARLRRSLRVTYESWLDTGRICDPDELARRLGDEQVSFLVVEGDFVFEEAMAAAPGLELIGICRNALNHVDVEAASKRGILVVNAPGRNAVAVAELTVGLMLALARHIPQADRYVKSGQWNDPVGGYLHYRGAELAGKTAGIIGLGAIGRMVARRLAAMDMRLMAHDPYVTPDQLGGLQAALAGLDDLLAQADFVLVHVPASESTMGMLGAAQLARMKPTACLVNASAPGVVQEEALARALGERRIAGAALDVFEGHPLPESSPLRALDNVVLTPHIGGSTQETIERQSAMMAEDILLVLAGEPPKRLVNPQAWQARQGRQRTGRPD